MKPSHARNLALKVGSKAFIHATNALHRVFVIQDTSDEEPMPPATRRLSEPMASTRPDPVDDLSRPLFDDDEARASILLANQLRSWFQEDSERESDLQSIRSNSMDSGTWPSPLDADLLTSPMFPPPKNARHWLQVVSPCHVVSSRRASVHDASEFAVDDDGTSYAQQMTEPQSYSEQTSPSASLFPPAMNEQQTGVIRSSPLFSVQELSDRLVYMSDSSLHRSNAMRRPSNPLFARPKMRDFDQARMSW